MKKLGAITLGIITSVGGALDVGSIATSMQAGALFGYGLLWALALGTVCIAFLAEMAGRLAAVSRHTLAAAMREHFGINFDIVPLLAQLLVDLIVLAAEVGGTSLALQLVTGISFQWWSIVVGFVLWALLWFGTFAVIENGGAAIGMITILFVVAAFQLHPSWAQVASGLVPRRPAHDATTYWFLAVSIIGAAVTPYIVTFYSSGAVEDEWDASYVPVNRVVAGTGMLFGNFVSAGVMIVAALVLQPLGILVSRYEQGAVMMTTIFPRYGFLLFAAGLFVAGFSTALEVALDGSYIAAQGLGWNWSENMRPKDDARFSLVYTAMIVVAVIPTLAGLDPLKITLFSMALAVLILPLVVVPLLVIMNDKDYLGGHRNGWITNTAVIVIIVLAFALAVIAIPLEILGS